MIWFLRQFRINLKQAELIFFFFNNGAVTYRFMSWPKIKKKEKEQEGTSLAVQWLHCSSASSIPGQGTKMPHAVQWDQKTPKHRVIFPSTNLPLKIAEDKKVWLWFILVLILMGKLGFIFSVFFFLFCYIEYLLILKYPCLSVRI